MSYTPTIWENGKAPAINADNLNKIENELVRLGDILGGDYALASEAGYSLDVSMNDEYVLTLSLKNKAEEELSSKSIDLPIESMIIDMDYADGNLTMTLQNGKTIDVSIADIVSGLVKESRKIAGMDLTSDISVEDLQSTLEILSLKDDVEELKTSGGGGGGGDSTMRYVNDESDSNFDWIQVKNADGTWVNWKRAYISDTDIYLFFEGDEFADITGGFARYNGEGSITNDGAYLQIVGKQNTSQGTTSYYGTEELIDLSLFNSIEVVFSANLTAGSYNAISFGVSSAKGGEFASVQNYTWNNNYTNEKSIIDVSNIDSGYFQIMDRSGYSTKASIVSIKLVK